MYNSLDGSEGSMMGWGNRGWLEIIEYVLVTCKNGSLKTHVMYKCNLNSQQIRQYFQFLLNCGLLERHLESPTSRRFIYKTTARGKKYMDIYKQMADIFIQPETDEIQ